MKEIKINKKVFIVICSIIYIIIFIITSNLFWHKGYDKGINEIYKKEREKIIFEGGY